jgi:hypothetical protein
MCAEGRYHVEWFAFFDTPQEDNLGTERNWRPRGSCGELADISVNENSPFQGMLKQQTFPCYPNSLLKMLEVMYTPTYATMPVPVNAMRRVCKFRLSTPLEKYSKAT